MKRPELIKAIEQLVAVVGEGAEDIGFEVAGAVCVLVALEVGGLVDCEVLEVCVLVDANKHPAGTV